MPSEPVLGTVRVGARTETWKPSVTLEVPSRAVPVNTPPSGGAVNVAVAVPDVEPAGPMHRTLRTWVGTPATGGSGNLNCTSLADDAVLDRDGETASSGRVRIGDRDRGSGGRVGMGDARADEQRAGDHHQGNDKLFHS